MSAQEPHEQVLRDALEDVFVIAAGRGIDTGQLVAEFDADRGPGPHQERTLMISLLDTSLPVTVGVPREWLSTGTEFIDSSFSQRIAALLSGLERKARREARFI